ncbi:MAG: hypothetical protein GXY03_13210 [Solirubrobacterales bacterium]|nr:hypothetical protein [Solirubrobacterales bacterium]
MRTLACLVAVTLAATLAACGAPAELPREDGVALALARDRIAAAARTEERMAADPDVAARLLRRVRAVVATGALEPRQLDEFGLAALGRLRLAVPSLVIVDERGVQRALDRPALTAFLAEAETDPAAALRPAVAAEVDSVLDVLAAAEPGPDSEIPVVGMDVDLYLADLVARVHPAWPALAARLAAARSDL